MRLSLSLQAAIRVVSAVNFDAQNKSGQLIIFILMITNLTLFLGRKLDRQSLTVKLNQVHLVAALKSHCTITTSWFYNVKFELNLYLFEDTKEIIQLTSFSTINHQTVVLKYRSTVTKLALYSNINLSFSRKSAVSRRTASVDKTIKNNQKLSR